MSGIAPIDGLSTASLAQAASDDLVPGDISTNAAAPAPGVSASFGELVTRGLDDLNTQLVASEAGLQRLAAGDTQNLHQVMIQMEESRLSLQLAMQVRNRLLEAYQDVMKMQV
jgi:flagellar hook-basal body complex protein FliE